VKDRLVAGDIAPAPAGQLGAGGSRHGADGPPLGPARSVEARLHSVEIGPQRQLVAPQADVAGLRVEPGCAVRRERKLGGLPIRRVVGPVDAFDR